MAKEFLYKLPAYDDSKFQSILQDFDLVNYLDESYFSYFGDLYLLNDNNQAVKIRTKPKFLFLLFYLSKKYSLKINYIEEEISCKLPDIKFIQTEIQNFLLYLRFKQILNLN